MAHNLPQVTYQHAAYSQKVNLKASDQCLPPHHDLLMSPGADSSEEDRANGEGIAGQCEGLAGDEISKAMDVIPLVVQGEELGYHGANHGHHDGCAEVTKKGPLVRWR